MSQELEQVKHCQQGRDKMQGQVSLGMMTLGPQRSD
jgi:hypothetical protein